MLPPNVEVHLFRTQSSAAGWRARAVCTDPATGVQITVRTVECDLPTIAASRAVQLLEMKLDEMYRGGTGPAWCGPIPP